MSRRMHAGVAIVIAGWIVAAATPAAAHLHDHICNVEVTVGWTSEPSFAGEPNGVQVILTQVPAGADHAHEEEGTPLPASQAQLTVEVIFGDRTGTEKLEPKPLSAFAFGSPGEWRTESFVPTRPGTYTFHITGKLKGKDIDKFYASGEKGAIEGSKYDDVRDVAAVSFPEKDPTNKDLSLALSQAQKTASAQIKKASDDAKTARLLGIIGIAVGVVGLGAAILRRPKRMTA